MKKILLVVPFMLLSFSSFAAEPTGQIIKKPIACFQLDDLLNYLKQEYNETLKRKLGKVNVWASDAMIFENEEKGSWTIIEYKENIGCVLAAGMGDKKI